FLPSLSFLDTLTPVTYTLSLHDALPISLTEAARPLSVTDLAALCDLPVTTVHRMTAQLEKRNLVKRAIGSKKLIVGAGLVRLGVDRKSTRLNSSHVKISYAVFCLKKKNK